MKKLVSGILAISLLTGGISCFAESKQSQEQSVTTTNCAASNEKAEKSSKINKSLKIITIAASTTAGAIVGWIGNDLVKSLKSRGLNKLNVQDKVELNNQFEDESNNKVQEEESNSEEENYNN